MSFKVARDKGCDVGDLWDETTHVLELRSFEDKIKEDTLLSWTRIMFHGLVLRHPQCPIKEGDPEHTEAKTMKDPEDVYHLERLHYLLDRFPDPSQCDPFVIFLTIPFPKTPELETATTVRNMECS